MLGYVGLLVALVVQPANAFAADPGKPPLQQFARVLATRQGRWCIGLCVGLAVSACIVLALGQEVAGSVVLALAFVAVPVLGQEMVRWILYARDGARAAAINDGITYGLQMFGALVLVNAAAQWATGVSALSVLGLSSALGLALGCWQLRAQVRNAPQRDDAVGEVQTRGERPGVPLTQRLAGT
jgi:prepilin signal peptidase PulO-like enzyme (type II secretory pathway)